METCRVFDPEYARSTGETSSQEFWGNKPAVPPLTTETVTPIIYLVGDDEPMN